MALQHRGAHAVVCPDPDRPVLGPRHHLDQMVNLALFFEFVCFEFEAGIETANIASWSTSEGSWLF